MKTRLVSYSAFGTTATKLPDPLEHTITTPLGELPTGNIHYPLQGVNAASLASETEVAFEYHNGTAWVEPPNARFIPLNGDFNHIEETPTRKYNLLGIGWLLRQAKVWEAGTLPIDKDGKVQFLSATAGNIMATLITNAKGRGWGSGITTDFSATTDSSGAAWASVITLAFDLELSLETILNNLYQQGLCDYRWEGRKLRIFNPDTTMARELTSVRLTVADNQTSAPEQWTDEDRLTDTLVIGEDGVRWTFNNGGTGGFGRLERVTTQSGVTDPQTAELLASKELLAGLATRTSYTREFVLNESTVNKPFISYLPGDWVMAQRGTTFERLRVVSVSVTTGSDGVNGHAVLGTRLDDILAKLAKRTSGITGGASAGGSGGRPAPEGPDTRTPSAPTGLVVSSIAFTTEQGLPSGRIQADWAHNGKATNGTVQTVDRYQLQRRINVVGEPWILAATTEGLSIATSGLNIFKADGVTPEVYSHRVRAVSGEGKPSAWSAETITTMATDSTPPLVPYFQPGDLTTWLRTIKIKWNGMGTTTGSNQVAMPSDFSHVNVYQNDSASAVGRTLVGRVEGDTYITGAMPAGVAVWYTLAAVDRSGNESAHSSARTVTPVANVDASAILATINAAVTTITNVGSAAITDGAILEGKLANNAVTLAKLKDGEIDLVKLNTAVNDKITKGITDAGNAQLAADASRALVDAAILSGHNLVLNGSFDLGDVHWNINSPWSFTRASATASRTGSKVMYLHAAGSTNVWPTSNFSPSAKGRTFYVEAWFKRIGAWTAGRVGFVLQTYTVTGLSTPIVGMVYGNTISDTVWTKVTATYTIPDTVDAYRTRFAPWAEGGVNTSTDYEVDDMLVIDVTEATQAKTEAAAADLKAGYAQSAADFALTEAKKQNLIINGNFEDAVSTYGSAARISSVIPHSGGFVGKLLHDTWRTIMWNKVPVTPGQELEVRYWHSKNGTVDPSAAWSVGFDRFDAKGTDLGVDGYPTYLQRNADTTTWQETIGRFTVPADTYWVQMRTTYSAATYAGSGDGRIDDVVLADASAMKAAEAAQARADEAFDDADEAKIAAGNAQLSANGKNNVYYLAALPSGTGYADGDTVFIRSAVGQPITAQWKWIKTGETTGSWNAETLSHQVIASVDLGKATVGELDGVYIKGKSIAGDRLLVSKGANLHPDPMVEDVIGWGLNGTGDPAATASLTGGKTGKGSVLITATATQQGIYYGSTLANRRTRAVPGATYRLSAWVFASAAVPVAGMKLYCRAYADTGTSSTLLSDVTGQEPWNKAIIPANTWTFISGLIVVAETAAHLNLAPAFFKQSTYTTGTLRGSDFGVQQAMGGELVVDGSITAGKITIAGDPAKPDEVSLVANFAKLMKLEVSSLIATTGNLGQAVIDKLWTDVVRSRKITTDMLVVGMGENSIVDPYLTDAATRALKLPSNSTWTTISSGTEGYVFRHAFSGIGGEYINVAPDWIDVEPGTTYRFAYSMGGVAVSNAPALQATYAGLRADGTTTYVTWPSAPIGTNASGWATVEQSLTVPADIIKIKPRIRGNSNGTGIVYVRFTHFTRKADASLIVDGGIVAKHLTVTDELTTKVLGVYKIKAINIDANDIISDTGFIGTLRGGVLINDSVTSGNIHATNGITAKHTITGAILQTEATASRGVKISSTGIKAWNSTGTVQTFDLVASTGALSVFGGTITGALFQTTATALRGIKIDSASMRAYDSAGKLKFLLDAVEGDAQFDSRVQFGMKTQPTWTIVPWESVTQERAGIWLVQGGASGIGGDEAAGMYMDNSNGTFANVMHIRGMNGAGVMINGTELTAPQITAPSLLSSAGFFHLQSNASSFMPAMQFTGRLLLDDTPGVTGTANAIISASGVLQKNTSASRYKIDTREMELSDELLSVPVKDWLDRTTMERQQELAAQYRPFTKNDSFEFDSIVLNRVPGVIAEEVEATEGGVSFVTYGANGLIESVAYDRFALARTQVLKRQLEAAIRRIELLEGVQA